MDYALRIVVEKVAISRQEVIKRDTITSYAIQYPTSSGMTTVAASASETPSHCARAAHDWVGASPRVRRAASSTGRRTCIHWLAVLWPMPHKHPWTTGSAAVFREVRMKHRRSSGVGSGPFLSTVDRWAVRGVPSRRRAARYAWNAASKGGTRSGNASSVKLVTSKNAVGRAYTSMHRTLAIRSVSFPWRHSRPYTVNRDTLTWHMPSPVGVDSGAAQGEGHAVLDVPGGVAG